jgi:3'-5' exoribonuclease
MTPHHPQKGPFIAELKPGDHLVGFYLVRHKQLEPFRDRTKGDFLTLTLGDRSGQMLARVWEGAAELAEAFNEGDVVKIAGDVEQYLNRTQIIVSKLRSAKPDEYDLADFLPATDRDVTAMLAEVQAVIERLQNPHLSALVRSFYDNPEWRARLAQAPAARRVHHAYLGGLLENLVDTLKLCETVLTLYPEINADLLYTGALLHDLGKVREYSWERDIDYTAEGRLIGHIVMTAEMVSTAMAQLPDFPDELRLRVQHMLVSHHGRYEWGSPRRPQTLEAIALHHIEDLSAQLNRFSRLLAARRDPNQPWTDYDRLLGRQLYAGTEDEAVTEESGRLE